MHANDVKRLGTMKWGRILIFYILEYSDKSGRWLAPFEFEKRNGSRLKLCTFPIGENEVGFSEMRASPHYGSTISKPIGLNL
jgi:hypothetical protein